MNRIARVALPAAGLLAVGTISGSLLGTGVAGAAPSPSATSLPATFQMYANVDAEFDLGSNVGAASVRQVPGALSYKVTFKKPIGHCAAAVQVGKAGGTDGEDFVSTEVDPDGPNAFDVEFGVMQGTGWELFHEPFMITVTCKK